MTPTTGGALTFPFDADMPATEAAPVLANWQRAASQQLGDVGMESGSNPYGFYAPAMGRFDENWNVVPTTPFSGEATMGVLQEMANAPAYVAQDLAASPGVRDVLARKYARDAEAAATGATIREDLQNTRKMFMEADWGRIVDLIRKGVSPAAALAAFGYSTSALAQEQ